MSKMAYPTRHDGVEALCGSERAGEIFGRAAARLAVLKAQRRDYTPQKGDLFFGAIQEREVQTDTADRQRDTWHPSTGTEIEDPYARHQKITLEKIQGLSDEHINNALGVAQSREVEMHTPAQQQLKILQQTLELRLGKRDAALLTLLAEAFPVVQLHDGRAARDASESRP